MTLNITLVGKSGIHQCSDFRLTDFESGPSGERRIQSDSSPKIVTLKYQHWFAQLTYCGVGSWQGKTTGETAAGWISALGTSPSFDDVALALEKSGTAWIQDFQRSFRKFQPHTFVLAGYASGVPRIAIISNTQNSRGSIPHPENHSLILDYVGIVGDGDLVLVTGLANTVSRERRAFLQQLLAPQVTSVVVRKQLAATNAQAAGRPEANCGISASCLCYSVDPQGGGAGELHGEVSGPFAPIQLINGLNPLALLGSLGPNAQMKQSAFATSLSSESVANMLIDCQLEFCEVNAPVIIRGCDIGAMNDMNITIAAANDRRTVVGQLKRPVSGPPRAFRWSVGASIEELGLLGGSVSQAACVNDQDSVVGSATLPDGQWRAVLWKENNAYVLGIIGDGNNSQAKAISNNEVVVGVVFKSPATFGSEYHRAFRWIPGEGMSFLSGLESCWSEARKINGRDQILGALRVGSFVWSEANGMTILEGLGGRPFHATAINDAGVVVGEGDDASGVRRPLIWTAEGGTRVLAVSFPFHPTSIDNGENVVGFDSNGPWCRGWLVTAKGEEILLPGGLAHSVEPRCIVAGAIFGHASKENWKHVHPVRWDILIPPTIATN